jgi:predicted transcriptional regulator
MAPHVYGVMSDKIQRAETLASIRQGLAAAAAGRVRPARQAILELAAEHGMNLDDDDAAE